MDDLRDSQTKLMEVAIDLFASRGFRGTSIRDIAGAMGMSISNIYHYYGSKEGLLLAILKHSAEQVANKLLEVSGLNMEPLDRFRLLIKTHILMSKNHKKEVKIFFLDEEHLSPDGNEINKQFQRDIFNIYKKELHNLKAEGYVKYENLTTLALNVLGVVNWHLRWYRPEGPLPLEQITDEILTFILHGVLGHPTSDTTTKEKDLEKVGL
ncbi:MAG: TetR/AcrR family transcriptional regulator [Deltaproteobacteria bacterium]|nr:MAG: TetR/AcrR family transcriptional regulator [Deltaproteobacteria bacterium]